MSLLKRIKIKLVPRDLEIIKKVATYKFLSTFQLQQRFFPGAKNHRTTTNRLTALARGGVLSRLFAYPKASPDETGHPTAIYYLTPGNLIRVKALLEEQGYASLWEDLQHLPTTHKTDKEFSHFYLVHELGISEFFLSLEQACAKEGHHLVFWERTSPFSKAIRERLTADILIKTFHGEEKAVTTTLPFNPDAFFCLKDPAGFYSFFFLEYDNNTSPANAYRRKLLSYLAYREQRRFPELLQRYYILKYLLPIRQPDRAGFRVLTVAPDPKRRDALFLEAFKLRAHTLLWFTSLTDIAPETALSPVWLRGKEFVSIAEEFEALPPETMSSVKARWLEERIGQMDKVSLKD